MRSAEQGAQSFLWAVMDGQFARGDAPETTLVRECKVVEVRKEEVKDEKVQKALWEETERVVKAVEERSAVRRTLEKRELDDVEKKEKAKEKKQPKRIDVTKA